MAFSPDHRTVCRNIHLQRQLKSKCDVLDRESRNFRRKFEDKQRECVLHFEKLQRDSKRFGIDVDSRPKTTTATGSEHRLRSMSDPVSHRRSSAALEKQHNPNGLRICKFERLTTTSPDTEAYTVYYQDPPTNTVSPSFSRFPRPATSAFSSYTGMVKLDDLKSTSLYMNRSGPRNTSYDIQKPNVLKNLNSVKNSFKKRSMSYSGPPKSALGKPFAFRNRAVTIGSKPSSSVNNHVDGLVTEMYLTSLRQNGEGTTPQDKETEVTNTIDETATPNQHLEERHVPSEYQVDQLMVKTNTMLPIGTESHIAQRWKSSVLHVPSIKVNQRRMSAPEIRLTAEGRVARSSHEARMLRRLSQNKTSLFDRKIEEADDTSDSESDDQNPPDLDNDAYIEKQVDTFVSNLKCKDILEDKVNSYLSSAKKCQSSVSTLVPKISVNKVKTPPNVQNKRKVEEDLSLNNYAKKKNESTGISNNKLLGLLRKPQMQLQILLNKIRDTNRAIERADRLKPKVKPKCTF